MSPNTTKTCQMDLQQRERGGEGARAWEGCVRGVNTEMDTGKHTQRDKTTRPYTLHLVAASCMVVHEKVVWLNNFDRH